MGTNLSPRSRVHVILIPGFLGFDVLGQLEYYAGVTHQFSVWKPPGGQRRKQAALHYFDNFPTAAVATRATRLRGYLAKRIARREFLPGDSLALVGHSTGGLDIRCLLWELSRSPGEKIPVDGTTVKARDILDAIRRVVFLSVPQWGTNIANWVRDYALGRALIVAEMRASVAASQVPLAEKILELMASFAAATRVDFVYPLRDALDEAEARPCQDPTRTALAQEAASEIALWLRHIATDFRAIDDLSSQPAESKDASPAHFNFRKRSQEIANWKKFGIETRSYATIGARPFCFKEGYPAPPWGLVNLSTYPEFTPEAEQNSDTDIAYRICYRACAGGPFRYPNPNNVPKPQPFVATTRPPRPIELWDNDGIVNTASMLWPDGDKTLLVESDHMDIVGHFRLVPEPRDGSMRRYRAYDLLKSGSRFHPAAFQKVWNDVFDFCTS